MAARTQAKPTVRVDFSDVASMTGREIRDFERVQPIKMSGMGKGVDIPIDTIYALAWIFHRRANPGVSFDDMLDIPFGDIEIVGAEVVDAEDDPTAEPDGETPTGS